MLARSASRLLQTTLAPRAIPLARPPSARACPTCASLVPSSRPARRPFSTSRRALLPPKKQAAKGVIRDEDIPHETVVVVDPTSKGLLPPSTVSSLLASLDRTRYAIQLADASHDPPICRIIDKKGEYDKAREKKVKEQERAKTPQSAANQPPREVHFTWGVSAHDLDHKLKKGKEFLEKGGRILVCLADKSGSKVKASGEVKGKVIRDVQNALEGFGTLQGRPTNKHGTTVLEFRPGAAKAE
ncbi:hypothetical protein JCM10213_006115 [Rhodosporidiobolus nylandii]